MTAQLFQEVCDCSRVRDQHLNLPERLENIIAVNRRTGLTSIANFSRQELGEH